jgi:hypothetical protein
MDLCRFCGERHGAICPEFADETPRPAVPAPIVVQSVPISKPKFDRKAYMREYMRPYMQRRRASRINSA